MIPGFKKIDWVTLAVEETMKSVREEQRLTADLEAERLSALQDQQQDSLCICGEKINDCPSAYEHMSGGV